MLPDRYTNNFVYNYITKCLNKYQYKNKLINKHAKILEKGHTDNGNKVHQVRRLSSWRKSQRA